MAKRFTEKPSQLIKPSIVNTHMSDHDQNSTVSNIHQSHQQANYQLCTSPQHQSLIPRRQSSEQLIYHRQPNLNNPIGRTSTRATNNSAATTNTTLCSPQPNLFKDSKTINSDTHYQQLNKQPIRTQNNKRHLLYNNETASDISTSKPYLSATSSEEHYECYPLPTCDKITSDVILKPPKDNNSSSSTSDHKSLQNSDNNKFETNLLSHSSRKRRHDSSYQKIMNERRLTYTVTENDLPKRTFNADQFQILKQSTQLAPEIPSSVADMNIIGLPLKYSHYGDSKVLVDDESKSQRSNFISDRIPQRQHMPIAPNPRRLLNDYANQVNGYNSQISSPHLNRCRPIESQLDCPTGYSTSQKNLDYPSQYQQQQQKSPSQFQTKLFYRPTLDPSSKVCKDDSPRYNSRMVGNCAEYCSPNIPPLGRSQLPENRLFAVNDKPSSDISLSSNNSSPKHINANYPISGTKAAHLVNNNKDSNSDDENHSRQPKFEAFIMTGDSMIKLSSSETEKQQKQNLCPFTSELTPAELYLSQQQNKLIQEKFGIESTNKNELDNHKVHNKNPCNDEHDYSNYNAHMTDICDTGVNTISKPARKSTSDNFTTTSVNIETIDKQKIINILSNKISDSNTQENGQTSHTQECSPLFIGSSNQNFAESAGNHSSPGLPKVNRSTQTQWLPSENVTIHVANEDISHHSADVTTNVSNNYTSNVTIQSKNSSSFVENNNKLENSESIEQQTTSSPVSSSSSGFYSSELPDQTKGLLIGNSSPSDIGLENNQAPEDKFIANLVSSHGADDQFNMSSENSKSPRDNYCNDYPFDRIGNQKGKIKELFLENNSCENTNDSQKPKQSKQLFGFLSGRKPSSCDNLLANSKDGENITHTSRAHGGHNNKTLIALSAALQQENSTISNDIVTADIEPVISVKKNTNVSKSNDAQSKSIANAAKRLFFSNKISTNNLPHAKNECTNNSHNDKESHRKQKKLSKSRKDNDLQNAYPLHAAISHDDLSNGPIPGTIRLKQSHFSSTPSVARDLRSDTIHGHISPKLDTNIIDEKKRMIEDLPLTEFTDRRNIPEDINLTNKQRINLPIAMDTIPTNQTIPKHDDIPIGVDMNSYKLTLQLQNDTFNDPIMNIDKPRTPTSPSQAADDRAAARRLAERLYKLDGFNESDVSQHLSRNNTFSSMVTEEYLQFFDFRGTNLDAALRKFLSKVHLNGETQERERILSKFSQHYYECNKSKFAHWEAVQTLVCALILLNTDLHGGHGKSHTKLSMDAFIAGLNDSTALAKTPGMDNCELKPFTFPKHMLVKLYGSIKKHPLKYSDDSNAKKFATELDSIYSNGRANTLPTRRFVPGANAPTSTLTASARKQFKLGLRDDGFSNDPNDASASIDFKTGYLMRKRIFEANGKTTPKGRRGWKRVYLTVKDLIIFIKIVEDNKPTSDPVELPNPSAKSWSESLRNSIRIHHAYASKESNYTKRDFVFHLRIADQAEYLFQASNEQEMNSWIETINFATACLSSPVLPSAVGSNQKKIQRPLFPSSYTKLSFWEQLLDHDERLQRLKVELDEHLAKAPVTKKATKKDRSDFIEKIALLRHEIERYTNYVDCMRKKSNSPEAVLLSKHSKSLSSSFKPSEDSQKKTNRHS